MESEDSREARDLVLAKHKGEALILGARDSFNPAKKKIIRDYSGQSSSWRTPLDNLFSSVNGSYLYPDNYDGFNEAFDKNEEKLRKELLENNDLKEIYNFGGNTVRVYQNNKAIFSWEKDKAFFYETVLTKEELDSFKKGIIERKLDELGPSKSSCHYDCSAGEFIQLNRDGGRRTFYYGGLGLSFYFQGIFWELQNSKNLKLNFWLEKYVKGLEVFPFDHRYTLQAMWKNGDDFRILVADNSRENIIREELRKLNEVDNNNEDLDYSEKEILRFEREKVREFEHLEWRKFEKGKLSGLIEEPTAIPYLMEKQQFPAFKNIDNNDSSFQSRTQNFEIRGGINQKGGLWKIGIGGSLIQIKEGVYANPIITPDGKWAVVSKAKENWSEPNFIYRISLQTGKEYKINIPAADNLNAVAFVQAHGKILIEKSDEKGYERINEKYFLVDPQTGIVQEVKGQFRPLKHQTYRPLQSNNVPNEFWAAISDGKDTEVGIYNTKLFSFRAVIKLPQIVLNSMDIWADESEQKIYIIYNYWGQESFLLSFPLPQKTVQTKQ